MIIFLKLFIRNIASIVDLFFFDKQDGEFPPAVNQLIENYGFKLRG